MGLVISIPLVDESVSAGHHGLEKRVPMRPLGIHENARTYRSSTDNITLTA